MSSLVFEDYQIGWICALEKETAAAMAMLDEEYDVLEGQYVDDHNSYVLGRIHKHNVVIASMPGDGVVSAARVATDMVRTFPKLRFGLMVGIGGGIPNLAQGMDIRLGDVVVSTPDKTWGGVVQYDHGKAEDGGAFTLKGQLNQPPELLLGTLNQLRARHLVKGSKTPEYIAQAVRNNPRLQRQGFLRPETADTLVCAGCGVYVDDVSSSCEAFHQREPRDNLDPVIHYGNIASGNVVVKDALKRDKLRDHFNALCVEMEAAGLMNSFPCLVIRGICDYADRHKNDEWHQYAAMTAAAYTKEFLYWISPARASQQIPIQDITGELQRQIAEI